MSQEADLIRQKHSVKVNNGSGVLIQPMSPDYAYVLTAKHCLKSDTNNLESADIQPHVISTYDGTQITVLDVIYHESEDMAVLIVNSDTTLELMVNCVSLNTNDTVFLCGYPEDRAEDDNGYSTYIYKLSHVDQNRLVLTPQATVTHSNVVGFSGGGIFTFGNNNDPVLLCAIETKMEGNIEREYHGNISAIPISEYEQLIESSQKSYLGNALAPLLPLHLSSFEHLIKHSFNVSNSWAFEHRLNFLTDRLKDIASENIIVNIFPHEILVHFKETLKVYSRPEYELRSRELWIALLELLTISILLDKPETIDIIYVEKILKSRRLVFIGVNEPWQQHIAEIFKAKLNDFEQDGIIVAKTLASQRVVSFSKERVKNLIDTKHIARPPRNFPSIMNCNTNVSKINSIVDLSALHAECIEIKEDIYENLADIADFNEEKFVELRMVLANEYSTYLTVEETTDE